MAYNCGVSFGLCRVRITRVDAAGNVIAGSNAYVTDKPLTLTLTPNIETGETISVRNGCGCSISRFKFNDSFNWFEFSFATAALEPQMMAFMLGADVINDGADQVGLAFPSSLDCDDDEPAVAFEFWTQHIVGSGQDGTYPWFHWVFPKTVWQLGDNTFEADAAQPTLNGFSRTNQQWGDGPYGDGPPEAFQDIREGAFWATDVDPPTAACASTTVTATS
jgi:hypothetical protein